MGGEADEPREWWERTFKEREDEFSRLFGPSHPPGAPEDKLDLLVGTSITGGEWRLAKQTTSAHLLLLLCRAGVGQRTVFGRRSVTGDPRPARDWESFSRLSYDNACERLASAGDDSPE